LSDKLPTSTVLSQIARPARLSDEVSRALEQRIRSAEYRPGSQLPTEKQLSVAFGVSRAVVREAVARLKAEGYVETRQGAGAYVAVRPGLSSFKLIAGNGQAGDDIRHIFELRTAVETTAAGLAAARHTPEDLKAMRRELDRMSGAIRTAADGTDADDAFHRTVAAASHNPYIRRFVEFLGHHFSDSRRPTWSEAGRAAGKPHAAQAEHERLYAAIARGSVRAARAAAIAHLSNSAKRLGIK